MKHIMKDLSIQLGAVAWVVAWVAFAVAVSTWLLPVRI